MNIIQAIKGANGPAYVIIETAGEYVVTSKRHFETNPTHAVMYADAYFASLAAAVAFIATVTA